jgi:histidine triad (HIT) family protein
VVHAVQIPSCLFCKIALGGASTTTIFEDDDIVAFLDLFPVRKGHAQIIPREHFAYFDELPANLLNKITATGQLIARAQKRLFEVERAGFLFSGGDIAHVHAHVIPMQEKADITSRQYIAERTLTFRTPPRSAISELKAVALEMRLALARAK